MERRLFCGLSYDHDSDGGERDATERSSNCDDAFQSGVMAAVNGSLFFGIFIRQTKSDCFSAASLLLRLWSLGGSAVDRGNLYSLQSR